MRNNLGVLLPVSSLPGKYGIGDFGDCAYHFIDWIKENDLKYWQILPLNPVGPAFSPYLTTCSKAIDIRYIDLAYLKSDGLLETIPEELPSKNKITYDLAYKIKIEALFNAFKKFQEKNSKDLENYKKANKWAVEFAVYQILKEKYKGDDWGNWSKEDVDFFKTNKSIPESYKQRVDFECFMQYIARKQWDMVLDYAHKKDVKIIADLPFYVGYDSTDCWMNKEQFKIDSNNHLKEVGGVPPDAFNEDGQLWGSPIYDFKKMKKDNYSFLIDRLLFINDMCDYLRLDHFRAFDTYYVIPGNSKTAKKGKWKTGPRRSFFKELYKCNKDANLIAEDLGVLFPSVYTLRNQLKLPGMYVFQFGVFDKNQRPDENTIVYTGTHDNETLFGWLKGLSEKDILLLNEMFGHPYNLFDKIIKHVISLPSKFTILPLQDILMLDNASRINFPGTISKNNWTWKLKDFTILKKKHNI